jgi:HK97 gp10 family phage protein
VDDLQKLERDLKRMAKFPTTMLTASVKKGAKIILELARAKAPEDKGNLRAAMKLQLEKSSTKGKKVYEITFDRAYNDTFAKVSKGGKRSYYPASQEFGWIMRNGIKHEGLHFMRNAADEGEAQFDETVVNEMMKKIEKAWRG